jgi:hypothetical protein
VGIYLVPWNTQAQFMTRPLTLIALALIFAAMLCLDHAIVLAQPPLEFPGSDLILDDLPEDESDTEPPGNPSDGVPSDDSDLILDNPDSGDDAPTSPVDVSSPMDSEDASSQGEVNSEVPAELPPPRKMDPSILPPSVRVLVKQTEGKSEDDIQAEIGSPSFDFAVLWDLVSSVELRWQWQDSATILIEEPDDWVETTEDSQGGFGGERIYDPLAAPDESPITWQIGALGLTRVDGPPQGSLVGDPPSDVKISEAPEPFSIYNAVSTGGPIVLVVGSLIEISVMGFIWYFGWGKKKREGEAGNSSKPSHAPGPRRNTRPTSPSRSN